MARHSIAEIHAHEILDSRGNPTVRAYVQLQDGTVGMASVPSGASTGSHEAVELRDGDKKRFGGKGVLKAVRHVHQEIAKRLKGKSVFDQRAIDQAMKELDGTPNKRRLGANAILGVSLAAAHAGAKAKRKPLYRYVRATFDPKAVTWGGHYRLPTPTMILLNGGAHAGWTMDLQETMLIPQRPRFHDRLRMGAEVFHALKDVLTARGLTTLVGDEGGFAPKLKSSEEALELLVLAVKKAGYKIGKDAELGIDVAASELYQKKIGTYVSRVSGKKASAEELINLYEQWRKSYPLTMIEDGLAEDDWTNWQTMTKRLGKQVVLVGDDLFVTSVARIEKGIAMKAGNAVLIKVNQIGTLSEAIDAVVLAQSYGYKVSVSHRSGETEDTTIADLAVAVNADFIKAGSASRSERLCKYNRLLEIEAEL